MSTGMFPLATRDGSIYANSMETVLQSRLKQLLKERSVTRRKASLEATGKPDTIRDIFREKVKSPQAQTVEKLANYFGVTTEFLTKREGRRILGGEASSSLMPARVIGLVQAGAFMEADADDKFEADPHWIATVRDPEYPQIEPIAYQVAGDSIDQQCAAGGFAICLPFAETGLEIRDGMWVVAARSRGALIERTIKQVRGANGRFTLHPSSSNPRHKPISFPSAEKGEEVIVVALVRRFLSPPLRW